MIAKELFPDEYQRRYVTFALNCGNHDYWNRQNWYSKREREKFIRQDGACLVFGTGGMAPERIMSSVARTPFVLELFGTNFWLTGFKDKVVVADDIVGKSRRENPPIHFGCVRNGKFISWSEMRLDKYCLNIAKFSDCFACPEAENVITCVRRKVEHAMRDMGIDDPFEEWENDGCSSDALYDDNDMEHYLCSMSKKSGWTYIKPGNFSEPFTGRLNHVLHVYMDDAEEKLKEGRERWELGKKTSAAIKRCENECYIQGYCSGPCKPYYSTPHNCQTGAGYGRSDILGPFSEEEFNAAFRVAREKMGARPEHEIRQIAANAGISTWIFGHELMLCKMASNLRDVQFVRPTTMKRFTYTYEDAMTLLHTPYRHRRTYEYAGMQRIEAEMSEKSLNIYTEACQYDYAREYNCYWPGRAVTPYVQYLGWNVFSGNLSLVLKPGWTLSLTHVAQAHEVMERCWRPVPSIVNRNLDVLKELRARAEQETSQGKQP